MKNFPAKKVKAVLESSFEIEVIDVEEFDWGCAINTLNKALTTFTVTISSTECILTPENETRVMIKRVPVACCNAQYLKKQLKISKIESELVLTYPDSGIAIVHVTKESDVQRLTQEGLTLYKERAQQ